MKWKLQMSANDFSVYEFLSADGKKLVCKYNYSQGSLRLKYDDHYSVFFIDTAHLHNRRFLLNNVYGSETGSVIRNLWHVNTGTIIFSYPSYKLHYKIDSYLSIIEIAKGGVNYICEIGTLPHPGREDHFMRIIIALAWMYSITADVKIEAAA